MKTTFDEAYARYLHFLAKLDTTQDISEKNRLFKQLAEPLSELETQLKNNFHAATDEPVSEDPDSTYWI